MIAESIHQLYFDIGFDSALHNLKIPTLDHKHSPQALQPLQQGYSYGQSRTNKKQYNIFIKKWLQIRLRCIPKNRPCTISPQHIEKAFNISNGICPILNQPLTFAEGNGLDWSIERLDNSKGYEPDNIVVISVFANQVRDRLSMTNITTQMIDIFKSYDNNHIHQDNTLLWFRIFHYYIKKLPHNKHEINNILASYPKFIAGYMVIKICIEIIKYNNNTNLIHKIIQYNTISPSIKYLKK